MLVSMKVFLISLIFFIGLRFLHQTNDEVGFIESDFGNLIFDLLILIDILVIFASAIWVNVLESVDKHPSAW